MVSVKWTPGSWQYDEVTGAIIATPTPENGGVIVCCEPDVGAGPSWDNWPANRSLILAAPDLAEALDRVIAIVQYEEIWSAKHVSEWDAAMNAARSALSKAKGE